VISAGFEKTTVSGTFLLVSRDKKVPESLDFSQKVPETLDFGQKVPESVDF
jgi:hypothetical protein